MEKTNYHHGDLANALITAALQAVERQAPEDISLRGLAEQLGVSRAAPYRHFADRDALLAATAARGFEDLCRGYEEVLASDGDGPERLRAGTRLFLASARKRPGLHKLMFESDFLARNPPPAVLIPPANRAYELLVDLVAGAFPRDDLPARLARTIVILSTTVGYLTLNAAGRFKAFMRGPLSDDDLDAAIVADVVGDQRGATAE